MQAHSRSFLTVPFITLGKVLQPNEKQTNQPTNNTLEITRTFLFPARRSISVPVSVPFQSPWWTIPFTVRPAPSLVLFLNFLLPLSPLALHLVQLCDPLAVLTFFLFLFYPGFLFGFFAFYGREKRKTTYSPLL